GPRRGQPEPKPPDQAPPGHHPGRRDELVEVLEAAHLATVEVADLLVGQGHATSTRSSRPASASCCLYFGNTGLNRGTSLRIFATGPLAFICPRASATVTLTLPSQKRCAVSAAIVITTSGSMLVGPQSTCPSSPSISLTVICDSGSRYWYWTIVFALRNLGASSSASARCSTRLAR